MASNKVNVTFTVNSDGTLTQVANQANKAAQGLDKATTSTTNYNRAARGVANLQQNQTKAFAATARGTSGLVAAYATLMAHVFALTAAFGALQRAAALEQLEKGLIAVGSAGGQNLPYVAREIQALTGHAVTLQEAMEGTALAMSAGFGINQLKDLTKVAKGASIALGRNMGDALTRLVKGTAKLEPEILDELGILVRLDKASQDYAASLGKTVTQLTRFEKQQAFLNATIDQGQKKFSVVLDSIDPDPYSKLGAAFQDLVKDVTTFINIGLIPVIDLLSENKFAMYGALILFASSITKMLVPALGEMSKANQVAAQIASASATRAAGVVEVKYVRAVRNVSAAFKTVPPSVKAVEQAFRSGSLSVTQYQTHLVNLQKSERLRSVALKNYSGQQLAQKQKEINDIRALIAATQQLIAVEAQRGMAGSKVRGARQQGRMSRRQSAYQGAISNAGVFDAFKIAGRGAKNQFKEIAKATKGLNTFRTAISATSKSLSLFGSAFLRLIPFVGQAMMIFSILSPLMGNIFKKNKVVETTNEVVESFDSFVTIASQLNTELEKTDSIFEKTNKRLSVRVGLLNQVSSGLSKVLEEQQKQKTKEEKESLEKVIEAQETYDKELKKFGPTYGRTLNARQDLIKAEAEYAKTLKSTNELTSESAKKVIDEAAARIKAAGLAKTFGNELKKLAELRETLNSSDTLDANEFLESVQSIEKPAKALQAAQQEANEATIKLEQQVKSFTEQSKGMFGELFTNVSALNNALISVKDNAKESGSVNIELVTKEQRVEVERLAKALGVKIQTNEVVTAVGLGIVTDYYTTLQDVEDTIAKNNKTAAEAVEKARGLNQTAKAFKEISKGNSVAFKMQLDFQKEANQETLKGLNAALENKLAQEGIASQSKEVLQLLQQIKNTEDAIAASSEDTNRVSIALVQQKQKLLTMSTKQSKIEENIAKLGQAQVKRELELIRKRSGRSLSASDQTKLLKKAEEENAKIRKKSLEDEKKKINLEYDLLSSQFTLEELKIKRLAKELKLTDEATRKILAPIEAAKKAVEGTTGADGKSSGGLRSTAIAGAEAKSKGEGDAAAHAINMSEEKQKEEAIKRRIKLHGSFGKVQVENTLRVANAQQHLKDVLNDPKSTEEEKSKARADAVVAYGQSIKSTASEIATSMAAIGPEGALMAATMEATGGIAESFTSAFAIIGDSAASMSEKVQAGLAAGMAIAQGYSAIQKASSDAKIRGIDQEIEAEKRRDGQSTASVAKLQALENKKEQAKRKAFEQDKKAKQAQTIIATAQGVTSMLGSAPPPLNFALAAMVGAMGMKQLQMISSTSYQGGGAMASSGSPSSIQVGERKNIVDLASSTNQAGELAYARGEQGIGTSMSNFKPAFSGYKNRATGGFVVGEQGPELFVPQVPGDILPSGKGTNNTTSVNFSINALDSAGVEELLINQRGNIIGMIREAANEHGEFFLENVQETSY